MTRSSAEFTCIAMVIILSIWCMMIIGMAMITINMET